MPGTKTRMIGIKSQENNVTAFCLVGIFTNYRRTPVHENSKKKNFRLRFRLRVVPIFPQG